MDDWKDKIELPSDDEYSKFVENINRFSDNKMKYTLLNKTKVMELQFEDNEYYLVDENNDTIATTDKILLKEYDGYMKKLSKENCDDIFGVVDVEILSDEYSHDSIWFNKRGTYNNQEFFEFIAKKSFTDGFNKAMELNKDKLFTVEDIMKAFEAGYETLESEKTYNEHYDILIQSLQQPTEIEVDIKMEPCYYDQSLGAFSTSYTEDKPVEQPKLDKDGCLILKKK
jgi:hypothetical protein